MIFINFARNEAHRYWDGLVILCVLQVASFSIVHGQYGASAVHSLAIQWYGLALLYAAASWLASAASPTNRGRIVGTSILIFGSGVCVYLAQSFVPLPSSTFPLAWYHWMSLSVCFLGRACCRISFRK